MRSKEQSLQEAPFCSRPRAAPLFWGGKALRSEAQCRLGMRHCEISKCLFSRPLPLPRVPSMCSAWPGACSWCSGSTSTALPGWKQTGWTGECPLLRVVTGGLLSLTFTEKLMQLIIQREPLLLRGCLLILGSYELPRNPVLPDCIFLLGQCYLKGQDLLKKWMQARTNSRYLEKRLWKCLVNTNNVNSEYKLMSCSKYKQNHQWI